MTKAFAKLEEQQRLNGLRIKAFGFVEHGNIDALKAMIESGEIDANFRELVEKRPLLIAAADKNDKDMVIMLLAQGADVYARDSYGRLAVDVTLSDEVIDILIRAGSHEPITKTEAPHDAEKEEGISLMGHFSNQPHEGAACSGLPIQDAAPA